MCESKNDSFGMKISISKVKENVSITTCCKYENKSKSINRIKYWNWKFFKMTMCLKQKKSALSVISLKHVVIFCLQYEFSTFLPKSHLSPQIQKGNLALFNRKVSALKQGFFSFLKYI